jgi:peptidoglycan/LPS O-acetylase OafA/YrhL
MMKVPMPSFLKKGDYSYGIYLYGFPIQQALVAEFHWIREWYILFPISGILALIFAVISWHFIERPFLQLKYIFREKKMVP